MTNKKIDFRLVLMIILTSISFFSYGKNSTKAFSPLNPLSYEEAIEIFRKKHKDEVYRCAYIPADKNYEKKQETPIAVEIDDFLYINLNKKILELHRIESNEDSAVYINEKNNIEAKYIISKRYNISEYGESDDRNVKFWIKTADNNIFIKAFGNRCGI